MTQHATTHVFSNFKTKDGIWHAHEGESNKVFSIKSSMFEFQLYHI